VARRSIRSFHGYPANLWWPWAVLGALIVLAAGFTASDLGPDGHAARGFEIGVFVVLGVFLVIHAGSHNTWRSLARRYTPSGYRGLAGVFAGSVYTIWRSAGSRGRAVAEEAATRAHRPARRC